MIFRSWLLRCRTFLPVQFRPSYQILRPERLLVIQRALGTSVHSPPFQCSRLSKGPELQGMNLEGETIKPDDEDEDGSKDIDTEDIDSTGFSRHRPRIS
jgi:hypothetical protein